MSDNTSCTHSHWVQTMTDAAERLKVKLLELSPKDRVEIAHNLFLSLDEDDPKDVADAWEAEINRRIQSVERGEAKLIPAEEVFARLGIRFP